MGAAGGLRNSGPPAIPQVHEIIIQIRISNNGCEDEDASAPSGGIS